MLKKLYVRLNDVRDEYVSLYITEQSHRGEAFGYKESKAFFSREYELYSVHMPSWYAQGTLFVRGSIPAFDSINVHLPLDVVDGVLATILAYNQYYNKNKLILSDVVDRLELWEKRDD